MTLQLLAIAQSGHVPKTSTELRFVADDTISITR